MFSENCLGVLRNTFSDINQFKCVSIPADSGQCFLTMIASATITISYSWICSGMLQHHEEDFTVMY